MYRDVKRNKIMEGESTCVIKHDRPEKKINCSGSSETTDYGKTCQTSALLYMPFFSFLFVTVLLLSLRGNTVDVEELSLMNFFILFS